jgi:hypothetical protein
VGGVALAGALVAGGGQPRRAGGAQWGTFNLGLHAWDQPAERLIEVAPARGVELVMPRAGEAVEPVHAEPPRPWWRVVDAPAPAAAPAPVMPAPTGEPAMLHAVPDPID